MREQQIPRFKLPPRDRSCRSCQAFGVTTHSTSVLPPPRSSTAAALVEEVGIAYCRSRPAAPVLIFRETPPSMMRMAPAAFLAIRPLVLLLNFREARPSPQAPSAQQVLCQLAGALISARPQM